MPNYPHVDKDYNYYADIHQYYLVKKKNVANKSFYPDYINNIKDKNQK